MSSPEGSDSTSDEARIEHAAGSIRDVTKDMVEALPAQGARLTDVLRKATVEAPLQSLAIAFLLGVLVARRR